LDFAQAPTDSGGTGVGLHCSNIQGKFLIFEKKKPFLDPQPVIFSQNFDR
jgi:hypothetical protein